jgi:TetR/AcrR family transcriptional regulator, transcriptional repressor for nem operon
MLDAAEGKIGARERILDAAEAAVLAKGFAATSIDELVAETGVSKSGFFYHFKDKGALAKAILERYLLRDRELLEQMFMRADELNDDPLHGFLVGLKFFAEMMSDLPNNHPGCIAASFAYQDQLFNREIHELNANGILTWRKRFRERFELIAKKYPPKIDVDFDALADTVAVLVEGGFVLGRALKDSTITPRQILLFRDYIRMIFTGS